MDKMEKIDCRATGEVILEVRRPSQSNFCEMPSLLIQFKNNRYEVPHATEQQ